MGGSSGRARPLTLSAAVSRLGAFHGAPEGPPTRDPFELVLFENVAYLASPARRRAAFEHLKASVGTSPRAILEATPLALESVTAAGILKETFAAKLRECARIATEQGGDLASALGGGAAEAKRVLRRFPGIGEPGAEKILLFSGRAALLAAESNGLRVLVRLGLVEEQGSYARTWAASREVGRSLGTAPGQLQKAHLLLKLHGESLCRRSKPRCPECPLRSGCAWARTASPPQG